MFYSTVQSICSLSVLVRSGVVEEEKSIHLCIQAFFIIFSKNSFSRLQAQAYAKGFFFINRQALDRDLT